MRARKRDRIRKMGLLFSSMVSIAVPQGHTKVTVESKEPKPCKKSRSPNVALPDSDCFDSGPPLEEYVRRLRAANLARQKAAEERFPWRTGINTTVFWVGEKPTAKNPTPNHMSSWDEKWSQHYGGFDDPDPEARDGFVPAAFTPKQNPFYVALPYNDIDKNGHKHGARQLIPWYKDAYKSRYQSVCKGRWLAIRKGDKVCYAQWEDAGPFTTDDADYVFGDAQPKANANQNAGLDVSPAVRDFLGLDGSDLTDWRFVDFEEVPEGPWSEHGDNNTFVINRREAERRLLAMIGGESKRTGRMAVRGGG